MSTPLTRFVLEDQLCFALQDAARAVVASYRAGLAELGLTYPQYTVMLVLWETEEISFGELCRRLSQDSATVSPVVKRLTAQGILEKRRRSDDERQVDVVLTDAGRALRDRVRAVQTGVERATGMTGPEIADLRSRLQDFTAAIRAAGADEHPESV